MTADSGANYAVFGPFVTPADSVPDSLPRLLNVRLTFRTPRGTVHNKDVNPRFVDALFLSMSAVDKFMIPYYSNLYGPEYARRMRDDVLMIPWVGHRLSYGDSLRSGGGYILPLQPHGPPSR